MITFRLVAKADFELLHRWLNIDFVSKWYERRKFVYKEVEHKYTTDLYINTTVQSFLILYDHRPIGYIQMYIIADYPEYATCIDVPLHTAGMDFFIGDMAYVGHGLGTEIITSFVDEHVFKTEDVMHCVTGPEPSNKQAIRVYEKAGFRHLKTVQCPREEEPEYLMIRNKKTHEHVVFTAEQS